MAGNGFLSFDDWSKPSQAKWFKQGTNQQGKDARDVYTNWLETKQGATPGFLSYADWSKPSQAKWFKQGTAQQGADPRDAYANWIQMLLGRGAAAQPPPGGGAGRPRGGGNPQGAGAPPAGGKPPGGGGVGNQASLGQPPPGGQPPPNWGPKGGRPAPGGGTIASQNRVPGGGMTPITGGGLQAGPAAEQQANPMDIISRLLRQYQGGQRGQSMMGGKG
jgi:hypothetical protein